LYGAHTDPSFKSATARDREVIRRVGVYLRRIGGLVVATVSCAVVSLGFGLLYPKLTRYLIDEVIAKRRPRRWRRRRWVCWAFLCCARSSTASASGSTTASSKTVIYDMPPAGVRPAATTAVNWFDQRASGDLMTRVIEDVNNVERLLIDGTEQGAVALLSITGALAFMLSYSPSLTLVALAPMPLLVAGALWYTTTATGVTSAARGGERHERAVDG